MNQPIISRSLIPALLAAGILVASGCGGDATKQETTTPKKLTQKQVVRRGAKAPAPKAKLAPAPAAKPTPVAKPAAPAPAPVADPFAKRAPPKAEVAEAIALVRRGRYLDAIRKAKAALKKSEKYTPAMEILARAYYHLGKSEFANGICDTAITLNPNSGKCFNLRGFIWLKRKNSPEAIKAFLKATEVESSLGAAWLNLSAQYLEVKNFPAALPAARKAVDLMGSRAEAYLNLGAALRGTKRLNEALAAFNKAIKLRANYPAALFNLGILYLDADSFPGMDRMGQLSKAEGYFNKYKAALSRVTKDDPANTYLEAVAKERTREERRLKRSARKKAREARRKAREAAKKAKEATKKPAAGAKTPAEAKK
ncbi:MAG: tetratricopeptide repeat protein [Deltaproteobacteria bacterium]|nr:tetratricopeptide repeat protein [Deltaproteobacteria bacterium]